MPFAGSNPATDPKTAQSAEMHLQNFEKLQSQKNTKAVSFRLREAQHHLRRSRNIIGRKPTSFEAMPQHRSFVPRKAAMKLPLRANDVACATQMMLCLRHK